MSKFSKILITLIAVLFGAQVVLGAPTSTILLPPIIPNFGATGNPCLIVSNTSGTIATSTCLTSGVATTTISVSGVTVTGNAFTVTTSTAANQFNVINPSAATIRLTIPSNVSFFTNDSGYGSSSAANPTASVGLSAINGAATTFMRSDGAPAVDQTIVPTWTGLHQFSVAGASTTQLWSVSSTLTKIITTNVSSTNLSVTGDLTVGSAVFSATSTIFNVTIVNPTTTNGYGSFPLGDVMADSFLITRITCASYPNNTGFTVQPSRKNSVSAATSALTTAIPCTGTSGNSTTTFTTSTLAIGSIGWIDIGTVSGTPVNLTIKAIGYRILK